MEYRLPENPVCWMGFTNIQLNPMSAARSRCGAHRLKVPTRGGKRLYMSIFSGFRMALLRVLAFYSNGFEGRLPAGEHVRLLFLKVY
jgi:hypothetical protein